MCKEDIQIILSFIPLKSKISKESNFKYEKNEFDTQILSQNEIHEILLKIFKNDEYIDQLKFKQITEEVCSEAFLFVSK